LELCEDILGEDNSVKRKKERIFIIEILRKKGD